MAPKDSQIDKKEVRVKKANGQTPISRENQQNTRNTKKQSGSRENPNSDR